MLKVKGLTKSYGKLMAVADVSFRADYGEAIGLLGPNGAGKTTAVSIIAGLLSPDSGEVLIEGKQVKSDSQPLGFPPPGALVRVPGARHGVRNS
jgi:ABC-2 type transport system ATP-binding protein